jgi:hypothetical protein
MAQMNTKRRRIVISSDDDDSDNDSDSDSDKKKRKKKPAIKKKAKPKVKHKHTKKKDDEPVVIVEAVIPPPLPTAVMVIPKLFVSSTSLPQHPRKVEWMTKAREFKIMLDRAVAETPSIRASFDNLLSTNISYWNGPSAAGILAIGLTVSIVAGKSLDDGHTNMASLIWSSVTKQYGKAAEIEFAKKAAKLPHVTFSINIALCGTVGLMPMMIVTDQPAPPETLDLMRSVRNYHHTAAFTGVKHTRLDILWDNSCIIDGNERIAAMTRRGLPLVNSYEYIHFMETVFEILAVVLHPNKLLEVINKWSQSLS